MSNADEAFVYFNQETILHKRLEKIEKKDVYDALALAKQLGGDIDVRIDVYAKCISKSTYNFLSWLRDDYRKKLNSYLRANFDDVFEQIHGHPPIDE